MVIESTSRTSSPDAASLFAPISPASPPLEAGDIILSVHGLEPWGSGCGDVVWSKLIRFLKDRVTDVQVVVLKSGGLSNEVRMGKDERERSAEKTLLQYGYDETILTSFRHRFVPPRSTSTPLHFTPLLFRPRAPPRGPGRARGGGAASPSPPTPPPPLSPQDAEAKEIGGYVFYPLTPTQNLAISPYKTTEEFQSACTKRTLVKHGAASIPVDKVKKRAPLH